MKKYFLKDSDQEVKMGQVIEVVTTTETPFGPVKVKKGGVVNATTLPALIKAGYIVEKEVEGFDTAAHWVELKPYVRRLARKMEVSLPQAVIFLAGIQQLSSRGHIDILTDIIAEVENMDTFPNSTIYVLDPSDWYKVSTVDLSNSKSLMMPKFLTKEGAEKAYRLIAPFVKEMLHEGE